MTNLEWHFDLSNSLLANFLYSDLATEITLFNVTLAGYSQNSEEVLSLSKSAMSVILANYGVSLNIINCSFSGFTSHNLAGLLDAYGGGSVNVENSHFQNIKANEGGVLRFSNNLRVSITNSTFSNNRADLIGGAICLQNSVYIAILNCTFKENEATNGGALAFGQAINYNISDSVFYRNKATAQGSAVFVLGLGYVTWFLIALECGEHLRDQLQILRKWGIDWNLHQLLRSRGFLWLYFHQQLRLSRLSWHRHPPFSSNDRLVQLHQHVSYSLSQTIICKHSLWREYTCDEWVLPFLGIWVKHHSE